MGLSPPGDLAIDAGGLAPDEAARFRAGVDVALALVRATPAGQRLLAVLADNLLRDDDGRPRAGVATHRRTTIRPAVDGHACTDAADPAAGNALWFRAADGARGPGTDVDLFFDPTRGERPDVVLVHELEHARHQTQGTMARGHVDGIPRCELQAIGLGEYAGDEGGCTENTYRRQRSELGDPLPPRTSYLDAFPPGAVPTGPPVPA
jgi:hypothetical protein